VLAIVDRTTADGLRIKAVLVDESQDQRYDSSADLPKKCMNSRWADIVGQLPGGGYGRIALAALDVEPGDVSLSATSLYSGEPGIPQTLASGAVDPRTIVEPIPGEEPQVVQANAAVAYVVIARGDTSLRSIRATWASGITDESSAVDGFAVVGANYVPTDPSGLPDTTPTELQLTYADGHSTFVETTTWVPAVVGSDGLPRQSIYETPWAAGECFPKPPSLPTAGPGPSDQTGAHDAVVKTVETAAAGALPLDDRLTAFVDPDRGRRIVEELGAANSTATVTGVVFISRTEAVVQFDLNLPPEIDGSQIPPSFVQGAFGKVVLKDGAWQITSETICKLVGGITPKACAGVSTTDYPPEVYAKR